MEDLHLGNVIYDLRTLAGIQGAINHLEGLKAKKEMEIRLKNIALFTQEVRDLLSGTGAFLYAHNGQPDSVRSSINGVSFIEHPYDNKIVVRLTNRTGRFVPNSIKIDGVRYRVAFEKSGNYSELMDL